MYYLWGREGGVDLLDCFNQFASQFHFDGLFLLPWLLKACGNVSRWCRFYLEFHVLFPLFQRFCSIESEAEVRLLSVHFLLFLILRLLCVCVCVRVSSVMIWLSFQNVKGKPDILWSSLFWLFLFQFYYSFKCCSSK